MTPVLELENILLRQGAFTLEVPRLSLQAGTLHCLRGENGSGKSTLLRLLALLQRPDQGILRFAGAPVSGKVSALHRVRQQVTLLEQTPLLFSGSVEQNLAFGLKLRGIPAQQRQERIAQALAATGLTGFGGRRARELSGGEVRRVALARALCLQPKLLLLDEPTANLDTDQASSVENFLRNLPAQGTSLVIATHDSHQPQRLGGVLLQISQGQVTRVDNSSAGPVISPPFQRHGELR